MPYPVAAVRNKILGGAAPTFASTITPTLGAELLNNPGLEAPYTDGKAGNWNKIGNPTLEEENTIKHGGASSQKITGVGNEDGIYQFQHPALTDGQWVRLSAWGYKASGAFSINAILNDDGRGMLAISGAAWQQVIRTGKFASNGTGIWPQQVGAGATVGYFDDASIKVINTPSMFGSFRYTTTTGDVSIKTQIKVSTLTQIGAWINVDDPDNPANGVCVVVDGVKLFIYKLVGGSWSTVWGTDNDITWSDYDELKITKVGTAYRMFRNDYPFGGVSTISDATVIDNVNHVQFSTDERNIFQTFRVTDIAGTTLKKITTLGDSITAGSTTSDYVEYVRAMHNYGHTTLTNRGANGAAIMHNGESDFADLALAAASDDADVIIVGLGTNDSTETGVQTEYTNQLNALKASNTDAAIYCMGILPCTSGIAYTAGKVAAINAAISAAAAAAGVTYWDTTGWIDPATETTDGLHPNPAGAYAIAQEIVARLA